MTSLDSLNALDAEALRAAFSGPPDQVATALRIAATGGAVEAQLRLGQMLLDGRGIAAAPGEALRWFGAAAKAGHPMGMNMVGRCLEHGWGAPIDMPQAAAWYRAAADRGLDWGMYNLATLLALGAGIAQDRAQALALFRRAAALGHVKSMTMIGSFHEDGWTVPADRAEAAIHYRRAAEGGDFRGQFNHARMLLLDGDADAAIVWLNRIPETATPRFLHQVRAWLGKQDDAALRTRALHLDATLRYAIETH